MALSDTSLLISAGDLARKLGAEIQGNEALDITGVQDPRYAGPSDLCVLSDLSYLQLCESAVARAWLTSPEIALRLSPSTKEKKTLILSKNPFRDFALVTSWFHPSTEAKPKRHPMAALDAEAEIDATAQIEAFVAVAARAQIGPRVILHPGVWIGEGAKIGEGTVIFAGAKVYPRCEIGRHCVIHAGAVVGSDGFGFVKDGDKNVKVPQVGQVIVGDHVEIGANSTIDRGTLAPTQIHNDVKIDNLVQIGHNCEVGAHSILCAFVGLSGSSTLGEHVTMAAQSGTGGHLSIGDHVTVAAQSGVSKDVRGHQVVKGYPARPLKEFLKNHALSLKLASLFDRLRKLEEKVFGSEESHHE